MDRRGTRRYNLSLPVTIQGWVDQQAVACQGRTRDISSRGIYLLADGEVKAGVQLNIAIILTASIPGTEVTLRAGVKVVRVEQRRESGHRSVGLATTIMHYELVRTNQIGSRPTSRPSLERGL